MIIIYTTLPSQEIAQKISQELLTQKLIACANWFPVTSMFSWQGTISKEREWVLLCKTIEENLQDVEKAIKKMHPYEIPCILSLLVGSNQEFFSWTENEVTRSKAV